MTRVSSLNILLLCDHQPRNAATVRDHIDALANYSRNHVYLLPIYGDIPAAIILLPFDAIVIHYTLVASHERYPSKGTEFVPSSFAARPDPRAIRLIVFHRRMRCGRAVVRFDSSGQVGDISVGKLTNGQGRNEHPVRNVLRSFVSNELLDSAC